MIADPLDNGADELRFSGLQPDVEKHTGCVRILERTAVAVKPGCEKDAAGSRRDLGDDLGQIIIKTYIDRLRSLGDIGLSEINADLIQCQMILHPVEAFPGCLHFRKIVIFSRLCADDGGNHIVCIDELFIDNRRNPSARPAVDMGLPRLRASAPDSDERRIPAAAENRCPGRKSQLGSCLFRERSDLIRNADDLRQMVHVDAEHITEITNRPVHRAMRYSFTSSHL